MTGDDLRLRGGCRPGLDSHRVRILCDLYAATGRPEDALARWQRAFTLDPDNLSPRYSAAFLLERHDRLAEAAREWRFIIDWCEERGYAITADWPRRELQRLEARLGAS